MNGDVRNCIMRVYVYKIVYIPNRLLLNAHSRDLIKMCESMTIITPRLDKYLPIEYFNECYFACTNTPASISFIRRLLTAAHR